MLTLTTKNKTINLVFKTKKLVDVSNKLKGKNFEDVFFKAISNLDLDSLSKIIFLLAEYNDEKDAFHSSTEVYDFIDEYKSENKKTYIDIFKEIAEAVNDEGFFNTKMTKKQLEEKISNPLLQMNLEDITKSSIEKAMAQVATEQITVSMA